MKKPSLKQRLDYWFDNYMAGGSLGLIGLLSRVTIVVVLLVSYLIVAFGLNEGGGVLPALWDSMSTVINAWMPSYGDGSLGYIILMSVAAIVGLFITSILIGIISSGIEEKINSLKRGTSEIIEQGHIIVLGFYAGEYTLLRQLILAAADKPACIVIAGDMDQEEMQDHIRDNIEVPKNVRIVCRSVDIFDPKALERCAISACRSVIISPTDDFTTTKALLAVSAVIHHAENDRVRVGAIVSSEEHSFPPSIAARHNVTTLHTDSTLAKIIAHSCTQPGLSETFRELFNFEGSELYAVDMPKAEGHTFYSLLTGMDGGVPAGIIREDGIRINPAGEERVRPGDRLLIFAEDKYSAVITQTPELSGDKVPPRAEPRRENSAKVTVIGGGGSSLETVLRELPENVTGVVLCNISGECVEAAARISGERGNRFGISVFEEDIREPGVLLQLARQSEHIVILSDREKDEDEADMDSIFLLLNLRDIRTRFGLRFNITAEMRRECNQSLVVSDDHTDFVVASNMSSLFLAQLAESPELIGAFREILSNQGNELYLKNAHELHCDGQKTVAEIRRTAFSFGYIFLGYMDAETNQCTFNPPLAAQLSLRENDELIVLGES